MQIQDTTKKAAQRSFDIISTGRVLLGPNQSGQQVKPSASGVLADAPLSRDACFAVPT